MRTVEDGMDILRQFLMLRARFFISSQGGHQVSRQFGNGRRRRFRARGRRRQMTHQRRLLRGGRIGVGPVTEGVKIGAEAGDVLPGGFEQRVRRRIVLRRRSGQWLSWRRWIVLPRVAGIGGNVFGLPDRRRINVGQDAVGHEQQTKKRSERFHGCSLFRNQNLVRRQQ